MGQIFSRRRGRHGRHGQQESKVYSHSTPSQSQYPPAINLPQNPSYNASQDPSAPPPYSQSQNPANNIMQSQPDSGQLPPPPYFQPPVFSTQDQLQDKSKPDNSYANPIIEQRVEPLSCSGESSTITQDVKPAQHAAIIESNNERSMACPVCIPADPIPVLPLKETQIFGAKTKSSKYTTLIIPRKMKCTRCEENVKSDICKYPACGTHLIALIIFIFCAPLVFLPYTAGWCTKHAGRCPTCGAVLVRESKVAQ